MDRNIFSKGVKMIYIGKKLVKSKRKISIKFKLTTMFHKRVCERNCQRNTWKVRWYLPFEEPESGWVIWSQFFCIGFRYITDFFSISNNCLIFSRKSSAMQLTYVISPHLIRISTISVTYLPFAQSWWVCRQNYY